MVQVQRWLLAALVLTAFMGMSVFQSPSTPIKPIEEKVLVLSGVAGLMVQVCLMLSTTTV